jgi:hypothetical protein
VSVTPFTTGFNKLAATAVAGVALSGAGQTVLTWTAPSDGQLHRVSLYVDLNVTTLDVGGAVSWTYTNPAGAVSSNLNLISGGAAVGAHRATDGAIVEAGSTVTITVAALTGGAAVIWAELWGS